MDSFLSKSASNPASHNLLQPSSCADNNVSFGSSLDDSEHNTMRGITVLSRPTSYSSYSSGAANSGLSSLDSHDYTRSLVSNPNNPLMVPNLNTNDSFKLQSDNHAKSEFQPSHHPTFSRDVSLNNMLNKLNLATNSGEGIQPDFFHSSHNAYSSPDSPVNNRSRDNSCSQLPDTPPNLAAQPSESVNDSVANNNNFYQLNNSLNSVPNSAQRVTSSSLAATSVSRAPSSYNTNPTLRQSPLSLSRFPSEYVEDYSHTELNSASSSVSSVTATLENCPLQSDEEQAAEQAVLPPPATNLLLQRRAGYYRQESSPNPCPPTIAAMRVNLSVPLRGRYSAFT
jgi:hypothetical protein